MKKRIFSLMMMCLAMIGVVNAQAPAGQMPQLTPMPVMPGVRSGVLPNGLHYYVLHNAEPKNRANFYIAQKVGSTLETPEQLGLAHFLEHMAFNGTKTYPGKDLLNYLQSKGIRFGEDINAYTSFDETVYNIDNVPCNDIQLMDSVLLALRDWSCNILLEETEIDAERGVIHSEWRSRNDANTRMYTAILPQLYEEYQYEQMPIGSMDVVLNFKPQTLRDYYQKWYRPDQQGIIIVGDFDAEEMEKKVVKLFGEIPMPENAAERTYPHVSDNEQPIYVTYEDPELQYASVMLSYKFDPIPFEFRNTQEIYLQNTLLNSVMTALINNRLAEYAENPECKYINAGCWIGDYYVSKTKQAFNIRVICKNDALEAMNDAMSIVARACQTGFTSSELERVDSQILSQYEKLYNERDKTNNGSLGNELIRLFIDNEPAPGIEYEYQIISQVLPTLPVEVINQMAASMLTPTNEVMVVSQPKTENFTLPERETMLQALNSIMNTTYEAYVDEVITDPLIAKMPKKGKIKSEKQNQEFGTTEIMLSNGVKVVVKPTDYASDEVLFTMYREGGKANYPASEAYNVQLLEDAYNCSNFGNFDSTKLRKYLAGKKVDINLQVGMATLSFNGQSTVKDLPTLMELIYTSFAGMQPNMQQYEVYLDKAIKMLEMQQNDPNYIFTKTRYELQWGNNPVMNYPDIEMAKAASYDRMFKMLREATSNAANYTLIITGNVDLNALRPLLEQYVASLPSTGKKDKVQVLNPIHLADGDIAKTLDVTMQTPAVVVFDVYSGENLPYDVKNDVMLKIFSDVLDNNYITTLREEEGGTYGASVGCQMVPISKEWMLMYYFQTNEEKAPTLINRAHKEMLELLANGTNAVEFNKVREAMIKQFEISLRKNQFWLDQLLSIERGYNLLSGREDFMQNVTLDEFNEYIKTMYNGKNRIQLIMNGKPNQ